MSTEMQPFEQFTDERRFNILRPTTAVMSATNPYISIYANILTFDVGADTYEVDGGKRALTARALAQVASGAGISFVAIHRLDDGRDETYADVAVIAEMRRPDGTMIRTTGRKRVAAVRYVMQTYGADWKKNPKAVKFFDQFCKFVAERAETGAKNRAVRGLLAMKSSYPAAELAKPFVIPQIQLNSKAMNADPMGRQMLMAQACGAMNALYGGGTSMQLEAPIKAEPAMLTAPAPEDDDDLPDAVEVFDAAPSEDLAGTIRKLFAEREHGRNDAALGKMLEAPADKQQSYIDWLAGFPKKAGADTWHPSEKQLKRLFAIAKGAGFDSDSLHAFIAEQFAGITSVSDLTREQYDALCGDEKSGTESLLLASKKGGDDELPF